MAGGLEQSFTTPQKTDPCFYFERKIVSEKKLKGLFNEFLDVFLKEVPHISSFRPLPPLIGEGLEVDLCKLYIVVRKRSEDCAELRNGFLWSCVATDCGFDSGLGPALKLIYFKYLDSLVTWWRNLSDYKEEGSNSVKVNNPSCSALWTEFESNFKELASGDSDKMEKEAESVYPKKKKKLRTGGDMNVFEEKDVSNRDSANLVCNEDSVSRKRKRESCMSMMNWISKVAKDPCNPAIGSLPERQKWKSYGSELNWRQILWAREAMHLERNPDSSYQQSLWQVKQKMHPSIYDHQFASERVRCSQRIISAKDSSCKAKDTQSSSSGCQSEDDSFNNLSDSPIPYWDKRRKKRIPVGPHYQAVAPNLSGADYVSDSKWLGVQVWPLSKSEPFRNLIERDPIGRGRRESCGCQVPGSPDCCRFHISERRVKTKLELGSAFGKWGLERIGEEVALSWTKEDEDKFQDIVTSNRLSMDKFFWEELFRGFPSKGREALVSYYFNVFLVRRRCFQNRNGTGNIDSDDEDGDYGPIANRFGQMAGADPGSIFCSPKKSHLNGKKG